MKKIITLITALVTLAIAAVLIGNYLLVQKPLYGVIASDSRNTGIEARARYSSYYNPSILIFDLKSISGSNSSTDVFRVFLQYSVTMKEKDFDIVILSFRGNPKFQINGDYFKELGKEFGTQNPVYTIRTFPENVY